MGRTKKVAGNLTAIAAKRAQLEAELEALNVAEKQAREAERDAGRAVFMAALQNVKIGAMDRSSAKTIAKAIETMGGALVAEKLTPH